MELLATNRRWLQVGGGRSHKPQVVVGGLGSGLRAPLVSAFCLFLRHGLPCPEKKLIDVVVKSPFSLNVNFSKCSFHTFFKG